MSTRHLTYPSDFEIDHAAAHHEERRRRALQALDVGDVIATVEDALAQEADPKAHPLYPVAN
jgi:citrate lyase beta subunit